MRAETKSGCSRMVFSWSELLITTWVFMLVAGALGASLDWGTLSFWQSLGSIYLLKTVVSTATVSFVSAFQSTAKVFK